MKRIILFDIDDTLIDTSRNAYKKHVEICKKFGINIISEEKYRQLFGKYKFEDFIRIVIPTIDIEEYKKIYKQLKEKYSYKPITPNLNLLNLIYKLNTKGYDAGVLTNGNKEKTYEKLNILGINSMTKKKLVIILHSDNIETKKPDPKVFNKVLEKYSKDNIIYIGDSLEDLQVSNGAGVKFYGVLTGTTLKQGFINKGLDKKRLFPDIKTAIFNILKEKS